MRFGQVMTLRDQRRQQGVEQSFAAEACVVHKLKEPQAAWQLFLRDSAMGPSPGTQQRPAPLNRVDVDLMDALTLLIACVFAPAVAHRVMLNPPLRQPVIDVVFIRVPPRPRCNTGLDQGTDGRAIASDN